MDAVAARGRISTRSKSGEGHTTFDLLSGRESPAHLESWAPMVLKVVVMMVILTLLAGAYFSDPPVYIPPVNQPIPVLGPTAENDDPAKERQPAFLAGCGALQRSPHNVTEGWRDDAKIDSTCSAGSRVRSNLGTFVSPH